MKLQFIKAGEIVTTHGVRGEVKVLPWLDSAEMLCDFDRCRIDGKEYKMEACRVQKTCNLVKFQGIDTMEDAQAMRGKTVELYRQDIDGDIIFVERTPAARDGEIVVALIEDEATVKRLLLKDGQVIFMPENPDFDPIYPENPSVLGKVIGSYRRY